MFDTKTRRALAVELINKIFAEWEAQGRPWQIFFDVSKAGESAPVAGYSSQSIEGHGAYICQFWPLEPVEKIILGCEQIFDGRVLKEEPSGKVVLDFKNTEWEPGFREKAIREMASFATYNFLIGMSSRIDAVIKEGVEESLFLADAALLNDVAADNNLPDGRGLVVEARQPLDQFLKEGERRRRDRLVGLLGALPRLIAKGQVGRPRGSTKSEAEIAEERRLFELRIETALKQLITATRQVPTKTAVAQALRVGGLNPASGNDTSLQAFNNGSREANLI